MKRVKAVFTTLFLGVIISGCVNDDNYANYDANGDDMWDENEFSTAFNENGYYEAWDINSDNELDENEWNEGISNYEDYEGSFSEWDENDDNIIDENEFETNNFEIWDENDDGYVDNNEYTNLEKDWS